MANSKRYGRKRNAVYDLYRIIKRYKGYLIHVTEFENIQSILQHGAIFSKALLDREGIRTNHMTGEISHRQDEVQNFNNYVHLAYNENFDMYAVKIYFESLKNPAIIMIDPKIIYERKHILFSDSNAAEEGAFIGGINKVFRHLDFNAIYNTTWRTDRDEYHVAKRQANIMIPDYIEMSYIMEIVIPYNRWVHYNRGIRITRADTKKMLHFRKSKY